MKRLVIIVAALAASGCVTQQQVRDNAYADCQAKGGSADTCIAVSYQHADAWAANVQRASANFQNALNAAAIASRPAYIYQPPMRLQTTCMRTGPFVNCY